VRVLLFAQALCQYNGRTLTDNHTRPVTTSPDAELIESLDGCAGELESIYADCSAAHSDFELSLADFRAGVIRAIKKYLVAASPQTTPSVQDVRRFIHELQAQDLFLALACEQGNEPAWWEFDRKHRAFIESWTRHLARGGTDADEAIDAVYVELFGTRTVGGVRQSKFRTYTGRGTLRGWLRTVILHAVVDLYRGRQSEIPLDDWCASGEEAREWTSWPSAMRGTEESMMTGVVRERYRSATMAALDQSLAALDAQETLLLLYYHVEGLKLREIARLVEEPRSPIRRWFQRQSKRRGDPSSRIHESTVMRWLERVYRKVSNRFNEELAGKHGLNAAEIEICKAIVTEDPAQRVKLNLPKEDAESLKAEEVGTRRGEGAS
jgi:RNA polymerase sigma-70 factor